MSTYYVIANTDTREYICGACITPVENGFYKYQFLTSHAIVEHPYIPKLVMSALFYNWSFGTVRCINEHQKEYEEIYNLNNENNNRWKNITKELVDSYNELKDPEEWIYYKKCDTCRDTV